MKLRRSERVKQHYSYDEDALYTTPQVLSRLESLPTEIKIMIYSYVFSGEPFKQWASTNTEGKGLLRVNKNINKLASEVCHKEVSTNFTSASSC